MLIDSYGNGRLIIFSFNFSLIIKLIEIKPKSIEKVKEVKTKAPRMNYFGVCVCI